MTLWASAPCAFPSSSRKTIAFLVRVIRQDGPYCPSRRLVGFITVCVLDCRRRTRLGRLGPFFGALPVAQLVVPFWFPGQLGPGCSLLGWFFTAFPRSVLTQPSLRFQPVACRTTFFL